MTPSSKTAKPAKSAALLDLRKLGPSSWYLYGRSALPDHENRDDLLAPRSSRFLLECWVALRAHGQLRCTLYRANARESGHGLSRRFVCDRCSIGLPADSTKLSRTKRSPVEVLIMDNTTNRGEPDRSRISLAQQHEVAYWTKRLGVSREQLEDAVNAVGNSVEAVERHLRK